MNAVGAVVDRQGQVVRGHLDAATGARRALVEGVEERVAAGQPVHPAPGNTTLTVVVTNLRLDPRQLQTLGRQVHASMGNDLTVLVFIVVIIGGLGSIGGCFIGALLVAMVANYGGFLVPKLALVSNILLMVAILMWRPRGLYAVTSR